MESDQVKAAADRLRANEYGNPWDKDLDREILAKAYLALGERILDGWQCVSEEGPDRKPYRWGTDETEEEGRLALANLRDNYSGTVRLYRVARFQKEVQE